MKKQVTRLSPHQNGKVFGVLTALSSFVILMPFFLVFSAFGRRDGSSAFVFLLMPLIYLVFGCTMIATSCVLYNFMYRYIGGVEFEAQNTST
jgi:hypothetical protein